MGPWALTGEAPDVVRMHPRQRCLARLLQRGPQASHASHALLLDQRA